MEMNECHLGLFFTTTNNVAKYWFGKDGKVATTDKTAWIDMIM